MVIKDDYINALENNLYKAGINKQEIYIDYAERLLDNKMPVIFDINHFSLLLGIERNYFLAMLFSLEYHYHERRIPKKSGGFRQLYLPSVTLKYVQRWVLDNILCNMHVSEVAMGFREEHSIVDNARLHLNRDCVVNLDISDFFPSITFETVFKIFSYYGYSKNVSYSLATLCTFKDMLPQGSPASPYLSNVACLKLDKRLSAFASSCEAVYSRYADDITFSGSRGIANYLPIIKEIIEGEGFTVNNKKTRIAYYYQRQEVTGLVINNGKVRVNRLYKRSLLQEIYYCQKFGVDEHLRYTKCDKNFYKEHLYGKAYFVHMVEPSAGKKIIKKLNDVKWDY